VSVSNPAAGIIFGKAYDMSENDITKKRIQINRPNELDHYRILFIAAQKNMLRKKTKESILVFMKTSKMLGEVQELYKEGARLITEYMRTHPSQE
jgi:hypothetical protein